MAKILGKGDVSRSVHFHTERKIVFPREFSIKRLGKEKNTKILRSLPRLYNVREAEEKDLHT